MKRNLIAHCGAGNSDKIYMACVRENPDGTFSAIAKWGRRGKSLQQMFKLTNVTEAQAVAEQEKVFAKKIKTGYVDIDDSDYDGPVTTLTVQSDMEKDDNAPAPKTVPKPKKVTPKVHKPKEPPKEGVVICLDNAGIEGLFDKGIEYVFEAHKSDPTMIWVYDKEGKIKECFSERFEVVDEG